jgi:Fic family protein
MKKLPDKIPEKIDPAILSQLIPRFYEDFNFQKQIEEFNEKYLYYDELKYRVQDPEERNNVWPMMKVYRSMRLDPIPYPPVSLKYQLLPEILQSLHKYDQYLSGTIQVQNKELKLEERYILHSLMEEAIASSILEGAVTTRRAAREMLEKKRKPRTEGEMMVQNNFETLQLIKVRTKEPLTPDLIVEIQRSVTQNTIADEDVGHFRDSNDVFVMDPVYNTVHHVPPDHELISEFISELCNFINSTESKKFIHPIIKGIILHFLIGYIHPFNDGNGRTARSLFYWYTISQGYWLMEYLSISQIILNSKHQYSLAYLYSEYDEMDLTYFIKYHVECMNRALGELIKYLEHMQESQLKAQKIARSQQELTQRQAEILIELVENLNQEFTIVQISDKFAIGRETARNELQSLEKAKLISKVRKNRAFFYYANDENLKQIEKSKSIRQPENSFW